MTGCYWQKWFLHKKCYDNYLAFFRSRTQRKKAPRICNSWSSTSRICTVLHCLSHSVFWKVLPLRLSMSRLSMAHTCPFFVLYRSCICVGTRCMQRERCTETTHHAFTFVGIEIPSCRLFPGIKSSNKNLQKVLLPYSRHVVLSKSPA